MKVANDLLEVHNLKKNTNPEGMTRDTTRASSSGSQLGYRPALDGLRGIAVLVVMLCHFSFSKYTRGGFIGVDIFFVLSGFLITVLLMEEWTRNQSISLSKFYFRRVLRLVPALLLLLVCIGCYQYVFRPRAEFPVYIRDSLSVLFYYHNWNIILNKGYHIPLLTHTWSLAVEGQFYLFWPLILFTLLALRVPRLGIFLFVVAGVLVSGMIRSYLWEGPLSFYRLYFCTDTRADGLFIGCLAGLLASWGLLPRTRWTTTLLRLAVLASLGILGWYVVRGRIEHEHMYTVGIPLVSCAAAVLVIALMQIPRGLLARVMEFPVLVWFGKISYGLYLWHYALYMGLWEPYIYRHFHSFQWRVVLPFTLSILAASLSYYCVEQPILGLKKRLQRRRPTDVPEVGPSPTPRQETEGLPSVPPRAA